jgi:hypothetical protein
VTVTPSTTGYVDAAELVAAWLRTVLGYPNVTHELPTNLRFDMPLHVVERFGGADQTITLDVARLDIDTFCPDRATALGHAETIRQATRTRLARWVYLARTTVAKVETISAPTIAPYDSRNQVRRATQAVQLTLHQFTGV